MEGRVFGEWRGGEIGVVVRTGIKDHGGDRRD